MRNLLVARKSLLELAREWQLLLLVVATPLAFLVITYLGYSTPLLVTHPILVDGPAERSAALITDLRTERYSDGRPVFEVSETSDPAAAQAALQEQSATALVTVSSDGTAVTIAGDALYPRFYRASILVEDVIYRYVDRLAGRSEAVRIVEEPIFEVGPRTEFDLYAPGMILFGLLMIIPQTAMLVAREVRWGTLDRLRMTRLGAGDLLGGISLSQMAVAVVQVVLVFGAALALGFNNQGSLLLAIVVGLAISFSAIGLGLLVACFVENDGQAINVGSTVMMILVFFSGAMYQLPPLTVFTLAGHQIGVFDILPATHGFLALQQVLTYGAGLREIAFRLGVTVVLSLSCFALGVVTFRRLKMRGQ
jgi:ABC-type multidrug transport system permease subunit